MNKRWWTLSEIKELNLANGGRFFIRENMKFHGDTMKSFIVCNETDHENNLTGRVFINAELQISPTSLYRCGNLIL